MTENTNFSSFEELEDFHELSSASPESFYAESGWNAALINIKERINKLSDNNNLSSVEIIEILNDEICKASTASSPLKKVANSTFSLD